MGKTKVSGGIKFFSGCFLLLLSGWACADSEYDYYATTECIIEPLPPQYGGGIIPSPTFDSRLDGWTGQTELRVSQTGNKYIVAHNITQSSHSFGRVFRLQNDTMYIFSAWLQISEGKEIVNAFVKTQNAEPVIVGTAIANSGCWSMLKGGFQIDQNMNATLYFQTNSTEVELWLDNVSLMPFSREQWQKQQLETINKVRKKDIKIHVIDKNGQNIKDAKISINQIKHHFHIGGGTTEFIINTTGYQDWFASHFTAANFNNEMKWYYTEREQGVENYTVPDAMVDFFQKHGIAVRGHNILWADKTYTPTWVWNLTRKEIYDEAIKRTRSVVSRYASKVIAWDVMNENMHFSFFEDQIGMNASAMFFHLTRDLDPKSALFLNEYNTITWPMDMKVTPSMYVEKIKEIRSYPGNENMEISIGIEGHFTLRPNISYIRASLDFLGSTNMPIWFTELDTKRGPNQAAQLEDVMREAFAHPAVQGIIVWGGWKPTTCSETCLTDPNFDVLPKGCSQMCLTDTNFKNLPTADVVDKLLKEWSTKNVEGVTDKYGVFETNVFLGGYSVTVSCPNNLCFVKKEINVTREEVALFTFNVTV